MCIAILCDIHEDIHVMLVNPKISCLINIGRQFSTLDDVRGDPCQISSFMLVLPSSPEQVDCLQTDCNLT